MIITARQLEDLHRANGSNGHVVLPYRARLSPLAADWVRAKKLAVGYGDVEAGKASAVVQGAEKAGGAPAVVSPGASAVSATGNNATLWWCDGPCGPAKAAVVALAKEANLRPIEVPPDAKRVAAVAKAIAAEVKSNPAALGVLIVQSAATAVVFANRCPSLRAVVGTSLEAVEQGIQQVAANVLVIEHPRATLQQVKNLLGRFVRAKRDLSDDVRRQLQEMASCA